MELADKGTAKVNNIVKKKKVNVYKHGGRRGYIHEMEKSLRRRIGEEDLCEGAVGKEEGGEEEEKEV